MLPRLTPKQRQRANALIKRLCANYDSGNCLALDDGEPCVCVQSIRYTVMICGTETFLFDEENGKWFVEGKKRAVL